MNRWTIGLLLGFCVVFFANGLLIWFAVSSDEAVDASYELEGR